MTSNVHPIFAPILEAISGQPLTVSPEVAEAAKSTRTPADVRAARLFPLLHPLPRWEIWVEPRRIEAYSLEMTVDQAMNESAALDCLIKNLHEDFSATVIHTDAEGKRHDVSEKFARAWAMGMARQGWDAQHILSHRFIGTHFTNDEMYALCRSRG